MFTKLYYIIILSNTIIGFNANGGTGDSGGGGYLPLIDYINQEVGVMPSEAYHQQTADDESTEANEANPENEEVTFGSARPQFGCKKFSFHAIHAIEFIEHTYYYSAPGRKVPNTWAYQGRRKQLNKLNRAKDIAYNLCRRNGFKESSEELVDDQGRVIWARNEAVDWRNKIWQVTIYPKHWIASRKNIAKAAKFLDDVDPDNPLADPRVFAAFNTLRLVIALHEVLSHPDVGLESDGKYPISSRLFAVFYEGRRNITNPYSVVLEKYKENMRLYLAHVKSTDFVVDRGYDSQHSNDSVREWERRKKYKIKLRSIYRIIAYMTGVDYESSFLAPVAATYSMARQYAKIADNQMFFARVAYGRESRIKQIGSFLRESVEEERKRQSEITRIYYQVNNVEKAKAKPSFVRKTIEKWDMFWLINDFYLIEPAERQLREIDYKINPIYTYLNVNIKQQRKYDNKK